MAPTASGPAVPGRTRPTSVASLRAAAKVDTRCRPTNPEAPVMSRRISKWILQRQTGLELFGQARRSVPPAGERAAAIGVVPEAADVRELELELESPALLALVEDDSLLEGLDTDRAALDVVLQVRNGVEGALSKS